MRTEVVRLINWLNFIGATVFTISVYCCYLELINLQDGDRVYFFPSFSHWASVFQRVRWDTFTGAIVYMVASIVYNVMAVVILAPSLGFSEQVPLMAFLGGLGFFIGALCEVSHNCFGGGHGATIGLAVALLNCVGGLAFFLGGYAELFSHHSSAFINFVYLAGSSAYTAAAILFLVMWQGNDFGGTLLSQLNRAIYHGEVVSIEPGDNKNGGGAAKGSNSPQSGLRVRLVRDTFSRRLSDAFSIGPVIEPQGSHKLSLRGVASLCIYCWLFVCTTINLLMGVLLHTPRRNLADTAMIFIWMLGVKVVLVIHSAITTVPNEQPYRFAMQSMWFLLASAAVVQTYDLTTSIPFGDWTVPRNAVGLAIAANNSENVYKHPFSSDEL
jgi:hypothetical protein